MMSKPAENSKDISLQYKLLECVTCSWKAQAAYVAAELKIADLLADGPKTSNELANETGSHASSLHRLLRALCAIDICNQTKDGSFEITEMGALLGAENSGSLHSWTIWWGTNLWQVWGSLLYSVKTGKSARTKLSGKSGFDHLNEDPKAAAIFNQALVELTRLTAKNIVESYDFSKFKIIADVGGGYGELLVRILKASPQSTGILYDLNHAIKGANDRFNSEGLESRCEFIEGNFFESIPDKADAYILKSIIHDWNDEKSRLILENCKRAMKPGCKLILAEQILPDRFEESPIHQSLARSDLTMLAALEAGERTESDFQELLKSAGFRITKIVPAGLTFSIIEAIPV